MLSPPRIASLPGSREQKTCVFSRLVPEKKQQPKTIPSRRKKDFNVNRLIIIRIWSPIKTNTFRLVSGWFLRRLLGKISGYNRCKIMRCLSLCDTFFSEGGITWHHREFPTTDQKPFHESFSGLTLWMQVVWVVWWLGLVVISRGPQLRGYRCEITPEYLFI